MPLAPIAPHEINEALLDAFAKHPVSAEERIAASRWLQRLLSRCQRRTLAISRVRRALDRLGKRHPRPNARALKCRRNLLDWLSRRQAMLRSRTAED